jgi:FkbH-like protein
MPIAADCLVHLADAYMHFIHPLIGKVCKVLVVDLDNTLWGGVLGEDGPQGIQLNLEYPGAAYRAFQRVILDLYERGVILAICSKNDTVEALEVLENHPHMLLRPKHFASTRINWDEKTENLRQIATELNVGLDSLAFLDDSPVERAAVRNRLPEIYVVDLPVDAIGYAQALRECPVFERTNLSAEDKERGRYYAEQRQRAELQKSAGSLEEFYYSLEMKAEVSEADASTIPRIAQLTQKTNQFNLTTRKRTEQEVTLLAQDPHTRVFAVRLTDRFGDNGIVGAAISRIRGECCEIDTFLLSCRVIGRTVETAMLACIAEAAHRDGAKELTGWYFPTRKNAPAGDFYARHGFTQISEDQGNSLWRFDLTKGQIEGPSWIECKYAQRAKDYDARFPGAAGAPDRR